MLTVHDCHQYAVKTLSRPHTYHVVFEQLWDCGTMSFRNHTVYAWQNGSSKDRNIDMPFCIN